MIGRLPGKVAAQADGNAIVDVHGVGYEVQVPLGTIGRLAPDAEGRVTLHVHTHAREDALVLFGFATEADRVAFRTLIGVSSVGPKTALAILGSLPADALTRVIANKSLGELTQVPGIGKKTAERVVLELKDKLDDLAGFTAEGVIVRPSLGATAEDVLSALVNLGYPRPIAQKAVESAAKDTAVSGDFERLFRAAMAAVR